MIATIVIIVLLGLGWFWGFSQGFIKALSGVGSAVLAFFLSRQLTPVLVEKFGLAIQEQIPPDATGVLQNFLVAEGSTGRIIEVIINIVVFLIAFFIFRFLVNFLGSMVNATPLVGFLAKFLGGIAGMFLILMFVYLLMFWFLPWISSLGTEIPMLKSVEDFINQDPYIMPYIHNIGDVIFNVVKDAVITPEVTPEVVVPVGKVL